MSQQGSPQPPPQPPQLLPPQPGPQQSGPGAQGGANKTGLLIGGGALALVVVIVLIIAAVKSGGGQPASAHSASPGADSSTGTPSRAVKAYLEAIAAGDAKKVLDLMSETPPDTTFMTDDVLKNSNKIAPITGITVAYVPGALDVKVKASYKIGNKAVSATYSVTRFADGYKINDGYSLGYVGVDDLYRPTIDGLPVKNPSVVLLPGSYVLGTPNRNISFGKGAQLTVQSPVKASDMNPTPKLSAEGKKTFKDLVTKAVDDCLASKALKGGCGMGTIPQPTDGWKAKDGTVVRTLSSSQRAKLDKIEPNFDDYDASAEAQPGVLVDVKVTCVKGTNTGPCTAKQVLGEPTVQFAGNDPKLTWEEG